jgi:hypothetical protein
MGQHAAVRDAILTGTRHGVPQPQREPSSRSSRVARLALPRASIERDASKRTYLRTARPVSARTEMTLRRRDAEYACDDRDRTGNPEP